MDELFHDYDTLSHLLSSQKDALLLEDTQKCSALMPLIEKYSERISGYSNQLAVLEPSEQIRLKPILRQLLTDVESNQRLWTDFYHQLEQARIQLQSARRFAREMTPKNRRPRIVDHNG